MTCSRTERSVGSRTYWLLGVAAGALLLTAAGPALAQEIPPQAEPQSILPPQEDGPDSEPQDATPDQGGPDAAQAPADQNPPADLSKPPQSVEVDALGAIRLGGIGLLEPGNGGLPETLWKNSTAEAVTVRLLAIPDRAPSRTLQDLERRLLLTAAPPPAAPDDKTDLEFFAARLDRLAATGDLDSVAALLGRTGRDFHHERLSRLAIDVSLLAEQDQDACATAATLQPVETPVATNADWLRLSAFCRALGGDLDGAALALEMLADQKAKAPAFDALMAAYLKLQAAGGEAGDKPGPQLKSMKGATPLVLALARLTNAKLPPDVIEGASPLVLARLAQSPNLDVTLRLRAAEAVAGRGGFPLERLAQIYAAVPVKPADLANPVARAEAEPAKSVYAHALLYQAAEAATTDSERLAILRAGYARARAEGSRTLYASVMAPVLDRVTPSAESLPAASDIIRMLLLAGRIESAEQWYSVVRRQAAIDNPDAQPQAIALWPLMMIWAPRPHDNHAQSGAPVVSWSADALNDWIASRAALPEDVRSRQINLVATLLSQAGYPVPADLLPPPEPANPEGDGPGHDLMIVSREGRMGETVLEGLKLAGRGLAKLTPQALTVLGDGFAAVDLAADGRRVVTETLVIQGL